MLSLHQNGNLFSWKEKSFKFGKLSDHLVFVVVGIMYWINKTYGLGYISKYIHIDLIDCFFNPSIEFLKR